jgi:isopenicillin-N epimerase
MRIALDHPTTDFLLRPDMIFLNHGSFGACPRRVFQTYQEWQRTLEAQPVEFLGRRLKERLAEARQALGAFLNAPAADLVFVPNATHGVNIVARSLQLHAGDEVLTTNHEYGACDYTWTFLCSQQGAHYRNHPLPEPLSDPQQVADAFWSAVTERTKVIFLSAITSPTAVTLPVAEICRRARAAGILTVIDGAHVPGHLPLDLRALDADFYTGNCHKWLCAPKGAGFLYARPELQHLLHPLVVSWGWRVLEPGEAAFLDFFEWMGTDDPAAYLSVPAAIEWHSLPEVTVARAACRERTTTARAALVELSGEPQICTPDPIWWGQMATVVLPRCDSLRLKAQLWDEYQIELPVQDWNNQTTLRFSIQVYNTDDDIDRLLDALRVLLKRG